MWLMATILERANLDRVLPHMEFLIPVKHCAHTHTFWVLFVYITIPK